MKSTNFRRKETILRVIPEKATPAKKKKKINYDRLIYFGALVLAFLGSGFYVYKKVFFIKASGQVLLDNTMIRLTEDARILKFYKNEGDSVFAGDSLFMYFIEQNPLAVKQESDTSFSQEMKPNDKYSWIQREKYRIETIIAVNNTEISENAKLLWKNKTELMRVKNLVTLDALPYSRLENVQNEVDNLTSEVSKTQSENWQLKMVLEKLNGPIDEASIQTLMQSGQVAGLLGVARVFTAPCDGLVNRMYKNEYETALRTDDILSIQRRNNIYIKAYFEQKDLASFSEGDIVNVNFPDGTMSKGILKRFYMGTYPMPEEFQKKYEPMRRTIAADIFPLDDSQNASWILFNKLNAEITKFKF